MSYGQWLTPEEYIAIELNESEKKQLLIECVEDIFEYPAERDITPEEAKLLIHLINDSAIKKLSELQQIKEVNNDTD
jgi:hypothetical protein